MTLEKEAFFILTTILIALVGVVCTELVVMCSGSLRAAYLTVSVLFLLFFVFCGLPIKSSTLPNWLSGATEISVLRWALQACFINQFDGNTAVFPDLGATSTYDLYLNLFGWQDNGKWYCIGVVVLNIAVYKILTLLSAGIHVVRLKGGRKFRKDENVLLSLNKLV